MIRSLLLPAWIAAMLVTSGCGSNKNQDESGQDILLDVDNLWQGSIPVEYSDIGSDCRGGETSLLIPYTVSMDSSLHVELYGCWQGDELITCSDGIYRDIEVNSESNNREVISLWKGEWLLDCLGNEPSFRKIQTYEISSLWQRGELEIIVRNSDGDLTGFVTVE